MNRSYREISLEVIGTFLLDFYDFISLSITKTMDKSSRIAMYISLFMSIVVYYTYS
jgi:hypothetical protein